MLSHFHLAARKRCDGVDPDNVDGYTNNPVFPQSAATQFDFNRFLAEEAHARQLAIGLKNDADQLTILASLFEFAVNDQCHQFNECGGCAAFTRAGKQGFNAEYSSLWRTDSGARQPLRASRFGAIANRGVAIVAGRFVPAGLRLTCNRVSRVPR